MVYICGDKTSLKIPKGNQKP